MWLVYLETHGVKHATVGLFPTAQAARAEADRVTFKNPEDGGFEETPDTYVGGAYYSRQVTCTTFVVTERLWCVDALDVKELSEWGLELKASPAEASAPAADQPTTAGSPS